MNTVIQYGLLLSIGIIMLAFVPISKAQEYLNQSTIYGKVTDKADGTPIIGANVYIANSKLGAQTDNDGQYTIFKIPFGRHKLIVSYVGYNKEILEIDITKDSYEFDFELEQNENIQSEVLLEGKALKDWKKRYKKFEKEFLGKTKNAKKSRILNPYVVDFEEKKGMLSTYTDKIIEVENRAMGYLLYISLDKFYMWRKDVELKYSVYFKDLDPENDKEKLEWDKNRLEAYNGSQRHFFKSLYDENYLLKDFRIEVARNKSSGVWGKNPEFRKEVGAPYAIRTGEGIFLYEDFTPEKAFETTGTLSNFEKYLADDRHLKIIYTGEGRGQESILWLKKDRIVYYPNGTLRDGTLIDIEGHWTKERIADILPIDYFPEKKN